MCLKSQLKFRGMGAVKSRHGGGVEGRASRWREKKQQEGSCVGEDCR